MIQNLGDLSPIKYRWNERTQVLSFSFRLMVLSLIFLNLSCGGRRAEEIDSSVKAQFCSPMERSKSEEELVYLGKAGSKRTSYGDIVSEFNSACMSCHRAPANAGGFSYLDSFFGENKTFDGVNSFYPGMSEVAERSAASIFTSDPIKKMPPENKRKTNPEFYEGLGKKLQAWIQAGKPKGSFELNSSGPPVDPNRLPKQRRNEMGECIPTAEAIGFDYLKDRQFAAMEKLPSDLADTDIFTFDSYELAQKGTLSYNTTYPLWADNSDKGRWVHFPMKIEGGELKLQPAVWKAGVDGGEPHFDVPENTRFYKNFYRKIAMPNGKTRFKRIETRIIVVRKPAENSLFGSYKWDDLEQSAQLVETPYRNGKPFKDTLFDVVVDEKSGKTRPYAIPGSQRCLDCHSGSVQGNFVLGFSPLQLNHRPMGEGGREKPVLKEEASQVQRFISYGILKGFPKPEEWPKLELLGSERPRNEFELRAQGYMLGNCVHCHNPDGLALKGDSPVLLDLRAGALFGFNPSYQNSKQIPSRKIVDTNGELDRSHIYIKVASKPSELGITNQMPMHTPGSPDCEVVRTIGKWVRSFAKTDEFGNPVDGLAVATAWEPDCFRKKKDPEWAWIDQDFTVADSDTFLPRRQDWDSPAGMPLKFRNLNFSPKMREVALKDFAVGYWNVKPECSIPTIEPKPEQLRPWMKQPGGGLKKPFGEVYYTSPGSWFFRTSCIKCHGANADGQSSLSTSISKWTGGEVTVANLIDGMFGKKGANLNFFQRGDQNFAAQYMVWMAMEGTKVKFPPEVSSIIGKHGGQMLNLMREKCVNQINPEKLSKPHIQEHEVFREVCFVDNLSPGDPSLEYDEESGQPKDENAVKEWADRAAYNIGYSIFEFLKDAAEGKWKPGNDQCEVAFPRTEVQPLSRPQE